MALTQIADAVVPEIFTPYVQQRTQEKSRLIRSGAMVLDPQLVALLAGGGLTFNVPSWRDLSNDADNVSTDQDSGVNDSSAKKMGSGKEKAVRLSRNQSWSTADLVSALAGDDPAARIGNLVGDYWARRLQAATIATVNGIFANNDGGSGDLTHDISTLNGGVYAEGATSFTAEAFIDALVTMGDSEDALGIAKVHSVVYARMRKNNLIDFVPDSDGKINIPTFLGRQVIVDDGMPVSSGVYDTWLFGAGALRLGVGSPKVPTEVSRDPKAGNGGGLETLFSRLEWAIHPVGHSYDGNAPDGGPSNAAATNNLAHADSWSRVFAERKQIKIARLRTRES